MEVGLEDRVNSVSSEEEKLIQAGRNYLVEFVRNCTRNYLASFSKPTPEKPVPEAEAHVHFLLSKAAMKERISMMKSFETEDETGTCTQGKPVNATLRGTSEKKNAPSPVVFWFENQNLKHTPDQTLAPGKFETWIDRIIEDKLRLRRKTQLQSPFERSRMTKCGEAVEALVQKHKEACLLDEQDAERIAQAAISKSAMAAAAAEEARQMEKKNTFTSRGFLTPRMLYETPQEKLPIDEILQKVFEAADEEKEGMLPHKTVLDVLLATPIGLQQWDLMLLLASAAQENREGCIRYTDFIARAPDIIQILRERRKAANKRLHSGRVTDEAITLVYKDEMEETWRTMRELFEGAEPNAATTGKIPRGMFLECLESRPERFSPREITLLMQIVPTDEGGFVDFFAFPSMLRILRRESINHAFLEADEDELRGEVVQALNKYGYGEGSLIPLWTLREALNSTQLCLPRMLIHALLCMLEFDRFGKVDFDNFMQVVCSVVPGFFDRARFTARAERMAQEMADAAARAEVEELQGLTGGGRSRRKTSSKDAGDMHGRIDEEGEKGDAPDRETVEKTLIHLYTVVDEKRRGTIPLQTFISAMRYWTSGQHQPQQQQQPSHSGKTAAAAASAAVNIYSSSTNNNTSSLPSPTAAPAAARMGAVAGAAVGGGGGRQVGGLVAPCSTGAAVGCAAGSDAANVEMGTSKNTAIPTATAAAFPANTAAGTGGASGMSGSAAAAAAAERRYADVVASCRLTVEEVTGFVAEVEVDEHQQEVSYHEHIKTWIPTVFEIRKSPVLYQLIHCRGESTKSRYLKNDNEMSEVEPQQATENDAKISFWGANDDYIRRG